MFMSDESKPIQRVAWEGVYAALSDMKALLPSGEPPARVHWDHPDEDWKNEREEAAYEEKYSSETAQCIETFFEKGTWPRAKSPVRWYAHQRLEKAKHIVERWYEVPNPLVVGVELKWTPTSEQMAEWLLLESGLV
jgi:hypothetical protein